jgi:hypothetical protein
MTDPKEQSSHLPELTPFAQEVCTRYLALPIRDRGDVLAAVMRLTVEVTREFQQHYPEGIEEFIRLCAAQPRSIN